MANKRITDLLNAVTLAENRHSLAEERTTPVNEKIDAIQKRIQEDTERKDAISAKRAEKLKENPDADVSAEDRQISFRNERIERRTARVTQLQGHKAFVKLAEAKTIMDAANLELANERARQKLLLEGSQASYLRSSESLATQNSRCMNIEISQSSTISSYLSKWDIPNAALEHTKDIADLYEWADTLSLRYEGVEEGLYPKLSWWYSSPWQGLGIEFWKSEVSGKGLVWNWSNFSETADNYYTELAAEAEDDIKNTSNVITNEAKENIKEEFDPIFEKYWTHSNFNSLPNDIQRNFWLRSITTTPWYADESTYDSLSDSYRTENDNLRVAYARYSTLSNKERTLTWLEDVKSWFPGDKSSTADAEKTMDKYKAAFSEDLLAETTANNKAKTAHIAKRKELTDGIAYLEAEIPKAEKLKDRQNFVNLVTFHEAQGSTPTPTNGLTRVDATEATVSDGKQWNATQRWQIGKGGKTLKDAHKFDSYQFDTFSAWNASAEASWPSCLEVIIENQKKTNETNELKNQAVNATANIESSDYTARKTQLLRPKANGGYPLPDAKVSRVLTQYAGADWKSITEGIKKAVEDGKGSVIFEGTINGVALRILTELNYKVEALVDSTDYKTGLRETILVNGNVQDVVNTATKVSWDQAAHTTAEEEVIRSAADTWNWDTGAGKA